MMNGYSESSIPKSSKKRKNRMLDAEDGGSASDKKKKSRKHARADEVTDFDPKGKGKARAAVQEYSEEEEEASEFVVVTASVRLSVPPIFSTNPRAGVEEMLDSMIMKCVVFSRFPNVLTCDSSSQGTFPRCMASSLPITTFNSWTTRH